MGEIDTRSNRNKVLHFVLIFYLLPFVAVYLVATGIYKLCTFVVSIMSTNSGSNTINPNNILNTHQNNLCHRTAQSVNQASIDSSSVCYQASKSVKWTHTSINDQREMMTCPICLESLNIDIFDIQPPLSQRVLHYNMTEIMNLVQILICFMLYRWTITWKHLHFE